MSVGSNLATGGANLSFVRESLNVLASKSATVGIQTLGFVQVSFGRAEPATKSKQMVSIIPPKVVFQEYPKSLTIH